MSLGTPSSFRRLARRLKSSKRAKAKRAAHHELYRKRVRDGGCDTLPRPKPNFADEYPIET